MLWISTTCHSLYEFISFHCRQSSRILLCAVQALGNFSLYDYRKPHAVPDEVKGVFNVVVADPPYLVSMLPLCRAAEEVENGLAPRKAGESEIEGCLLTES